MESARLDYIFKSGDNPIVRDIFQQFQRFMLDEHIGGISAPPSLAGVQITIDGIEFRGSISDPRNIMDQVRNMYTKNLVTALTHIAGNMGFNLKVKFNGGHVSTNSILSEGGTLVGVRLGLNHTGIINIEAAMQQRHEAAALTLARSTPLPPEDSSHI